MFDIKDRIIVLALEEGFNNVFIGENCLYAIRIDGGKIKDIKYIAAYQTSPVSEITHVAEVESVVPYGEDEKYKLNFVSPAKEINLLNTAKQKLERYKVQYTLVTIN